MPSNNNNNGNNSNNDYVTRRYNYQYWEEKQVLLWIKINLLKNGYKSSVIDPFLNKLKGNNINGVSLTQFKNNQMLFDNFVQLKFVNDNGNENNENNENNNDEMQGIWTVVRTAILSLPSQSDDKQS